MFITKFFGTCSAGWFLVLNTILLGLISERLRDLLFGEIRALVHLAFHSDDSSG